MAGFNVWKSWNIGAPCGEYVCGWMINTDDYFLLKSDKNFKAEEKNKHLCFDYCFKKG